MGIKLESIDFKQGDGVAIIALNRPDAANGLNAQLAADLKTVAKLCNDDRNIRAIILTGNGRFFCAGGDIRDGIAR